VRSRKMSSEDTLFIVSTLCEYFSVREIIERVPELDYKLTGVYAFMRTHGLTNYKEAQKERKQYYNTLYQDNEVELQNEALSRVHQYIQDNELYRN